MSYTATSTATTTMTEARVRVVMQKVRANFNAFVVANFVADAKADSWAEDLTYLQVAGVLKFFEVQIHSPGRATFGIRYTMSADGSLQQDSASGGINLYGLPAGTTAGIYVQPTGKLPDAVLAYLTSRGWAFNGRSIDGAATERRAFSSEGYGLIREHIGTWP
jgi:hypothetical protein